MSPDELNTRTSFILGLQSQEQWAWERFYALYQPRLIGWARRYGARKDEAEELVSELVRKLIKCLESFRYDESKKSFRGYMRTILKHMVIESIVRRDRLGEVFSFDDSIDLPSSKAFTSVLDALCETESESTLIDSQNEVLSEVKEDHRLIWIAMTQGNQIPDRLAEEFDVSRATLYRIKRDVSIRIKRRYEERINGSK